MNREIPVYPAIRIVLSGSRRLRQAGRSYQGRDNSGRIASDEFKQSLVVPTERVDRSIEASHKVKSNREQTVSGSGTPQSGMAG